MPKRTHPYLVRAAIRPDAEIDYDFFPFNVPAVREIGSINFHPNVTFFVGENGAGKSTVLEGIAVALGFGTEGGTKNVRFQSAGSISPIHDSFRLSRGVLAPRDEYFLRAESFFNVASYMDETGYLQQYGVPSLHTLSHGESLIL